jgi:stearoyl-CoA 9-desaturase NADPH oxidoreductase
MPTLTTTRLLRSNLVDLLVGPHGIDRYLELIRPQMTVNDARAKVIAVRRQTARSVTLVLAPNAAWRGFRAGQFVRVGVEIDGIRRTRTYSPASGEGDTRQLELTVTVHPDGLVSRHLHRSLKPGAVVHLGDAAGDFVLPTLRPERIALISGGSGITPVLSMLRTLCAEGYDGEIAFIHYARTAADFLYRREVEALAIAHPNIHVSYVATREGGEHVSPTTLDGFDDAAVCGPPALIEAVKQLLPEGRVLAETFTPPSVTLAAGATAEGTLHFIRSGRTAPIADGSLLEQVEAAGLTPEFGCRMGICHTCTCRKTAGAVRNVLTGEVSDEEDEDIQLCVTVPAGDVALEL